MRLPNAEKAVVPRAKIVEYLLSSTHPSGRSKADFFNRFGFYSDRWEVLAEALKGHCLAHEVKRIEPSPFGTRYLIEGELKTPSGRSPGVRAVWFVSRGSTTPRLATAYPLR